MTAHRKPLTAAMAVALVASAALVPAAATTTSPSPGLDLGAPGLAETRTVTRLQPGVTLTTIDRGHADPAAFWTVEIAIPASGPDPDAPPTALSDRPTADAAAAKLRAAGLDPRVEPVTSPRLADAGGDLGYRVRVGSAATRADADAIRQQVIAAGLTGGTLYTGWDGEPDDVATSTGPWRVQVLTIDPQWFDGTLRASYGPDLERREKTSELGRAATAAVNAGFFVLDPRAGAPGDPAGAGVYDGRLLSEPVTGRPALVVHPDGRGTQVTRFGWRGSVAAGSTRLPLDGLNRVPGLIRNCGGTADDLPTSLPLHDVTCTDAGELVAFDQQYGAATPAGPGLEVVLDRAGRVTETRQQRGGLVPAGGRTVQATGDLVQPLRAMVAVGKEVAVHAALVDGRGRPAPADRRTSVLNGGPELVRDGRVQATPKADGMAPAGNPSFYYGWVHKRNPRTLAGVDAAGRTVLVTVDGRSTASVGLGIGEAAAVARSLGLVDAVNLDGGGSTTMVTHGQVVNAPSDATGERPVGDALVVLPR